ncbi:hypothetical protein [Psychroserpens sp. NJDZ02]|uniref:hypothetical protein n=1 Tax=Psychroserpens sp. NJDZ02 TaxID=2570561 RepID=UPI0010A891FE|nr:hypothetical protein [Psychroserpens sp. NJDZ02]QCE42432.1 hypothetical protein E9099_13825 [Psychroserpens sp. NJDZ02]
MKINLKKPYYTIYVYALSAGEIWINDVPILHWVGAQTAEGVYNGAIPLNNIVLENGVFQLECKLMPRHGNKLLDQNDARDSYSIGFDKREVDNIKSNILVREHMKSPYGQYIQKEGRVINKTLENLPIYIQKTKFEVTDLPFVLNGWQKSVDLIALKEEKLLTDVLRYYRQIHSLMSSNNTSKLLEIFKEKLELQEQAFYFSEEQQISFRQTTMELSNQKLEILPLHTEDLKLQIMGYGKLVRLVRLDGSAALQFKSSNPEKHSNIEFDIKLHMRNKENGLTII